jgi:hypothetical protein
MPHLELLLRLLLLPHAGFQVVYQLLLARVTGLHAMLQ